MSGRTRFPAPAVEDGIVWSDSTGPWLWLHVTGLHYDGLTDDQRVAALGRWQAALAACGVGEGHLLVVDMPFDVIRWDVRAHHGAARVAWLERQETVADWVAGAAFMERRAFLGVRLNRTTVGPLVRTVQLAGRALRLGRHGSDAESDRNTYRDQADVLARRVAAAGIPVVPAAARDLERLVVRPLWLTINRGARLSRGALERDLWGVHVRQPDARIVAASMVVTDTELGVFPGGEWLLPRHELAFEPDVSIRFDLVSAVEQARVWDKVFAAAADQAANMAGSDAVDSRISTTVAEQLANARDMAAATRRERRPWVWPSITVTVTGADMREVGQRCDQMAASFEATGVTLTRPATDQFPLLMEQQPGARWRVSRDWQRRFPLVTLAAGMPHATVTLGTDGGPYLGHTTWLARRPVCLDVLGLAPRNLSPTVAIVGAPGGGKSACAKVIAVTARQQGAWLVWLDPASETDAVLALPGLGRVQVVELDERFAGALDPWRIHPNDRPASTLLAVDLARMILPPADAHAAETDLQLAAEAISAGPVPSMERFVVMLEGSADPGAARVGRTMRSASRTRLASLFFGLAGGQGIVVDDAVTVLRWAGLDLADGGTERADWTVSNRLSAAVLHGSVALVAKLTAAADRNVPKLLVMDEAHQFTRSPAGRALVSRVTLGGRKTNTATVLVTQNAEALGDESMLNNVSVALAFRSTDPGEQQAVSRLLRRGRPDDEGRWVGDPEIMARVGDLPTGSCLLRDPFNRVGQVAIDLIGDELATAVQTTPTGAVPAGVL